MLAISLSFAGAGLALIICLLCVFHRDYHAGILGNLGLGMIAIVAASRLLLIIEGGWEAHVTPQGIMLWWGFVLFAGRQLVRFMVRSRTRTGWYQGPRPVAEVTQRPARVVAQ